MTNGEAVIAQLHTEIASLRAQLEEEEANAACAWDAWENVKAQLASARKALEAVWFDQKKIGNCAPDTLDLVRAELSLTDENGK